VTGVADIANRVQELRSLVGPPGVPPVDDGSSAAFGSALAAAQAAAPAAGTAGWRGADVVTDARKYLGVPYLWGGTDPATGLDCSGLVQRVYADLGVTLPRHSTEQAKAGTAVPDLAAARPGDILAFGHPVDHVAIYLGNGRMIAAPEPGDRVKVQQVYATPTAIRRILPAGVDPTPVARPAWAAGSPYAALFAAAGQKYGVPPALLTAVARVESGYDPGAVSPAGARGLMQLMPATARGLGVDPMNPAQAVDGAARLLAQALNEFGSVPLALAAYNAGPGAVRRYGGIPPYTQTQDYVRKVAAVLADLGGTEGT
jgi:peptidoglycan DL-endopeptidase CwlO